MSTIGLVQQLVTRRAARRPDAAFLPDPFSTGPATRIYKSGERGRVAANGTIYFVGQQPAPDRTSPSITTPSHGTAATRSPLCV